MLTKLKYIISEEYRTCAGPNTYALQCGSKWHDATPTCCTGLVCKQRKCVLQDTPTMYPTNTPPTIYPTETPPTLYPTHKQPTLYPTHSAP